MAQGFLLNSRRMITPEIITTWRIRENNFYIRTIGEISLDINWGDGTPTKHYTEQDPSHTYSTTGTYQIMIRGKCNGYRFWLSGGDSKIISVDKWGNIGDTNFLNTFSFADELETVAPLTGFEKTNNFSELFRGSGIKYVPQDLLKNCSHALYFNYFFSGCENLVSVPDGLMDYCPNATSLYYMFSSTGIDSIPNKLFQNLPEVTNYQGTFRRLKNVYIPNDLFNLSHISSKNSMFNACFAVDNTADSPVGTVQDIWNYGRTHLSTVPVFENCTSLSNYRSIPTTTIVDGKVSYWK